MRTAIALCLLMAAAPLQAQTGAKPTELVLRSDGKAQGVPGRYALIVAVDDYPTELNALLPPVKDLDYCVKGARELKQVLVEHGGFPLQNITELYNPAGTASGRYGPQHATRQNIHKWVAGLQKLQPPAELALVYFSGHGMLLDTDNPATTQHGQRSYYFMSVDGEVDPLLAQSTMVNVYEVSNNLENLTKSQDLFGKPLLQRAVLFVDACQNYQPNYFTARDGTKGALTTSVNFSSINPHARGIAGLTSCAPTQSSYEDRHLQNGVFTHFLVKALQGEAGADKDKDGMLTFPEVADFVSLRVQAWSEHSKKLMTPMPIGGAAGAIPLTVIRVPTSLTARQQAERIFNTGLEHVQAGRLNQALLDYQEAVRLDPSWRLPHNNLGNVYYDLRRYDEAIASFKEAIRLDPQDAYPHNNLGFTYFLLERYDEAIASYKEAIRLDPQYAAPHIGLGAVYYNLKRYNEAIASLKEAIRLDPQWAFPHNCLGDAYLNLKRYDEAVACYREALRLDPDYQLAKNNLKLAQDAKARRN